MSLNSQILSLLQTAGQALYDADQALQSSAIKSGDEVGSSMAENPFDIENDARFEEWKTIARLSKAVGQIESELRKVYGVANAWTSLNAPIQPIASPLALPAFTAASEIDVLHPISATDVVDKHQRRSAMTSKPKAASILKKSKPRGTSLRGNSAKLLAALQTRLTETGYTKLIRSSLAAETGLPKGSIGASFLKLVQLGYIEEDEHGALRLTQKL